MNDPITIRIRTIAMRADHCTTAQFCSNTLNMFCHVSNKGNIRLYFPSFSASHDSILLFSDKHGMMIELHSFWLTFLVQSISFPKRDRLPMVDQISVIPIFRAN